MSRLHEHHSADLADFPVPTGREEEWRFTPLRRLRAMVSLQDWAGDTVHLSHHHAQLGRDARLTHTAVTLGGGVVRLAPSVRYAGPGGR